MKPIAYLEDNDLGPNGDIVNPMIPSNIPVIVMIQASWCGHCTNSKPAFQEFANKHKGKVFCATIQADGERESEKLLMNRISDIKPDFLGFPDYMVYNKHKRVSKEINGRDVKSLEQFANL